MRIEAFEPLSSSEDSITTARMPEVRERGREVESVSAMHGICAFQSFIQGDGTKAQGHVIPSEGLSESACGDITLDDGFTPASRACDNTRLVRSLFFHRVGLASGLQLWDESVGVRR